MKLLNVDSLDEAREKLKISDFEKVFQTERIPVISSNGRVMAENIVSDIDVPEFRRSTVDGYAVRAKDTSGATESIPSFLKVRGEVRMGERTDLHVYEGEAIYVPTGAMIPEGADSVVMIEFCEEFSPDSIAVYHSAAPGKNVVLPGEDVKKGELLIKKGTLIRPSHIGALCSAGISDIPVFSKLRISIFSTGDELLSYGDDKAEGKVYDINTYSLSSEAENMGMTVIRKEVLNDDENVIRNRVSAAMSDSDIVIISGGSSKGRKDMTSKILEEVTENGVLTRGLALKPGKPTITAYDRQKRTLLIGLPGHPVAALIVFRLLAGWTLRYFQGIPEEIHIKAEITSDVASDPGKTNCQLVELIYDEDRYKAVPVFGKSGFMSTLTRSQGYTLIDRNKEGLKPGDRIKVFLL